MVEVFKTNVQDRSQANWLVGQIHNVFRGYTAHFDLEDCDKVLRVQSTAGLVEASLLVALLRELGAEAEVLPDDVPPLGGLISTKSVAFHK